MSRPDLMPDDRIIDRAIHIWKQALSSPVYQNLGPGEFDMGSMMASAMADRLPKDNTPEKLLKFGEALKGLLVINDRGYFDGYLSVDYDPCQILYEAAKAADLKMKFPWKTRMNIDVDHISFAMGYGAPNIYHYPLTDGRWLVTSLYGNEIGKVMAYVNGESPGFLVETESA